MRNDVNKLCLLVTVFGCILLERPITAFSPPIVVSISSKRIKKNGAEVSIVSRSIGASSDNMDPDGKHLRNRWIEGPPPESKPDYSSIHGPLGPAIDSLMLMLFRSKLSARLSQDFQEDEPEDKAQDGSSKPVGKIDSSLPLHDYLGIIELTEAMNSRYSSRRRVQSMAQDVLLSLFPSWLPPQYSILFARPFPAFSARMCAWATVLGGTWLMGECHVNDVVVEHGLPRAHDPDANPAQPPAPILTSQGVLVKRCRFLEESQCASICVNSCKIPTQNFFIQNMGLQLTMTPDYQTGQCQFAFGVAPTEAEEALAKDVGCLKKCPTGGSMRKWHDGSIKDELQNVVTPCSFMED